MVKIPASGDGGSLFWALSLGFSGGFPCPKEGFGLPPLSACLPAYLPVCLSVCYLYAICLPVCYPSVSVSLAYGKMSWHFRISVHPCLSLLSSLILSSLFACLFYPSRSCCVLFTLVTMPYHGISSRTRPQSNGHTPHLFALP